jgi:hypothetical protein
MDDTTRRVAPHAGDDETDLRTQEIREEIAQTRVEMSETIEAIQERLTPSHLVAQAGETVRNAATEKVKDMANTAGYAADRVMETSFAQTVRANPIPAAMIGIGTAWLLIKGKGNGGRRYRTRDYSRSRTGQTYGSTAEAYGGTGATYGSSGDTYGSTGQTYGSGERDWRAGSAGDATVGTSGYAYGAGYAGESTRVPEFGGEMRGYRESTRYGRRSVGFDRVVRENPLVVGAAAALVGVAIGLSLPASEAENRLMGEARDNVVDRARDLAHEATEKVQNVAGQAVEAATQVRDAAQRATGATSTSTTGATGAPGASGASGSMQSDAGSTFGGSTDESGTPGSPRSTTRRTNS